MIFQSQREDAGKGVLRHSEWERNKGSGYFEIKYLFH